jgi:hypothetical protein
VLNPKSPIPSDDNYILLEAGVADIIPLINELDGVLAQLQTLIVSYGTFISNSNIEVIICGNDDLHISVPSNTPDTAIYDLSKRVKTHDSVILDRIGKATCLIRDGKNMEISIREDDSSYESRILPKAYELRDLKNKYRSHNTYEN